MSSSNTQFGRKLNKKQTDFCKAYVGKAHGNATKAAILAGYSKKTARTIGAENLTKPDIKQYIKELQAKNEEKEAIRLSNADIYENWANIIRDDDVSINAKIRVLDNNARANGMYIDKVDVNVNIEMKNAERLIIIARDTLAYATSFLTQEQNEMVIQRMQEMIEESENEDDSE